MRREREIFNFYVRRENPASPSRLTTRSLTLVTDLRVEETNREEGAKYVAIRAVRNVTADRDCGRKRKKKGGKRKDLCGGRNCEARNFPRRNDIAARELVG